MSGGGGGVWICSLALSVVMILIGAWVVVDFKVVILLRVLLNVVAVDVVVLWVVVVVVVTNKPSSVSLLTWKSFCASTIVIRVHDNIYLLSKKASNRYIILVDILTNTRI